MIRRNRLLLHIFCPLLLGFIMYYLLSPDVLFVNKLDQVIGDGTGYHIYYADHTFMQLFRNYGFDMLWSYALVFSLFCCFGENTGRLKTVFITAFLFSAIMESLQLTSIVRGTFDVWDIGVELAAEGIALLMIKKLCKKGNAT